MTRPPTIAAFVALAWLSLWGAVGCDQERARTPAGPVYEDDIARLLRDRCDRCHGGSEPAGGFSTASYLDVIGCTDAGPSESVVDPADDARLLSILEQDSHADLLDEGELARLRAWVLADVPLRGVSVHGPGILHPGSDDWHGKLANADGFARLRNPGHPEACARCHAGTPYPRSGPFAPAAGATACTACHDRPDGVLACSTCHGQGDRPYPPRPQCLFGDPGDAHSVHVEGGALQVQLSCDDCHPTADARLLRSHGNGRVDVVFSTRLAGADASYDDDDRRCSVACHARGGERPQPAWDEDGPLSCGDCHKSPPEDHFAGACDRCHRDSEPDGSGLRSTAGHLDGRTDLQRCGACHGEGDDPWPVTPSHQLHRQTALMAPIQCKECHPVPEHVTDRGHLDRDAITPADVVFSGRAVARGVSPDYADGCGEVACHGAGLRDPASPPAQWDRPAASAGDTCTRCHGAPPDSPHSPLSSCAGTACHGAEVTPSPHGPAITSQGRRLHIDGEVQP